jgi:hypothetical protein
MQKGNKLSMVGGKKYHLLPKKNQLFATTSIFWSFMLNEVRKGRTTLDEIMAIGLKSIVGAEVGSGGCGGSCAASEIVGYTDNSPPLKRRGMCAPFLLFSFLLLTTVACKNFQCEDGTWVKKESECNQVDPWGKEIVKLNIKSTEELRNSMSNITLALKAGKRVELNATDNWAISLAQFQVIRDLGALTKKYNKAKSGTIVVNMNGYKGVPAVSNEVISFYEWDKMWNRAFSLGANPSGSGAKGGTPWTIGSNEEGKWLAAGEGGDGAFKSGGPIPDLFWDIEDNETLQATPTVIQEAPGNQYENVFVKITGSFDVDNGADENALDALFNSTSNLQGMFQFIPNSGGMLRSSSDSTHAESPNVLNGLYALNALMPTNMTDRRHWFVTNTDAIPPNQVVRTHQKNSDDLNLTRVIPNRIDIIDEWNVSEIPPQFFNNWTVCNIKLVAADRPELPGGRQNIGGCTNQFLYHLRTPVAPEGQEAYFCFYSDENLMLTQYGRPPPPYGPNALQINHISYGCNDNSGPKLEQSWFDADHSEGDPYVRIRPGNLQLNVQTDRPECKASDGKIILGELWIADQLPAVTGAGNTRKIILPSCKLYLDHPILISWYEQCEGNAVVFFERLGVVADPNDVDIVLELEPGKQAFGVAGQVNLTKGKGSKQSLVKKTSIKVIYTIRPMGKKMVKFEKDLKVF